MVERTSINTQTMTATDFLSLPETTQPMELIDGEVIMSPAPDAIHQRQVKRLVKVIDNIIPNGETFIAPFDVRLDDSHVVQPDLLWISENSQAQLIDSKFIAGPPDLVIEIFSPGSVRNDKTVKFNLYQKHGVKEYWMIDPHEQYLELWSLSDDQFTQIGVFGPDDTFTSPVLGNVELSGKSIFE